MSVFGVDFGNLNSTVAITRYGGVDIVTNEVSKRETTTIVSFTDQERFIGEQGLDRYVRNAQNTIFLLKRCIGMHMDDPNLAAEKEFLTCAIQGDEKGKLMFGVNYCGEMKYFYPEQALAMMLQKLREYVNITATTDPKSVADVRDCVVTVPSYYTPEQRRLMYQACDVAGLHCMTLVNETTASAVDYGIFRGSSLKETEEEAQVVGILDIGYGCTDFLVAKFWRGNCKVLSHSHDFQAGTRAVDYELFKEMAKQVKTKYNVDVTENKRAKLRLLQACERLKYFLSANQSAPLHVENIMDIDISFPAVERSLLESLGAPIAERIRDVIGRGIAAAKVDLAKFHTIEMIGGGCRIPLFKRLVEEVLGRAPGFTLNASETIARGAAITAAMMSPKFQVREFRVAEVPTYPVSLGYHVENCREPVSIPFLPQVNKVVPLLADGDHYPRLMEVTVPCTGTFRIYAFNDPNNAAVKGAMHGSYLVGEWELGAHTGKVQGELRDTKIRVNIRPDGLVQVDGAWATDSFEVEVKPEEAKEAKQEGEGAPAAAAPATEGKEAEGKKKRKCRLLDVTIAPNVELLGHSSEAVVKFRSAEHEMHNRDCEIIRTREKKNELESYILDYRPRLSEGGALFDYVTATDRQHFLEQCEADETWLYDEGEQATLEEYTARVVALRSIGDAAFNRHKTRDDTDFALKGFNTRMAAAKNLALAKIGQAAHITEEELRTVAATADEAITWGATSVQEMLAQPKTEACKFTTTDLNTRAAKVENDIRIVVNRPTPPPPKPAPAAAKPAEEAKPADAPAEAEPATEATAEPAVPNGVELD